MLITCTDVKTNRGEWGKREKTEANVWWYAENENNILNDEIKGKEYWTSERSAAIIKHKHLLYSALYITLSVCVCASVCVWLCMVNVNIVRALSHYILLFAPSHSPPRVTHIILLVKPKQVHKRMEMKKKNWNKFKEVSKVFVWVISCWYAFPFDFENFKSMKNSRKTFLYFFDT